MKTLVRAALLCALAATLVACQDTKVVNDFGSSITGPTSPTNQAVTDVLVIPGNERVTSNPCEKTVIFTATVRGSSPQQSVNWSSSGPSTGSFIDRTTTTATFVMRGSGTYTVTATSTQNASVSGSVTITFDCGGATPSGPFNLDGPFVCTAVRGEYNVSFRWTGPSATRIEYKSARDGVWRDAFTLVEASLSGNSFSARRVRSDSDQSFRVWSGGTLWGTSESEATCRMIPACRNTADDDGDGLIDAADPGCHSNNDINQPYNPDDNDESNPLPPTTGPGPGGPGPGGPTPTCAPGSIQFNPAGGSGRRGTSTQIGTTPSNCGGRFTSDHPNWVSVSSSGGVTYLNVGCATIRWNDVVVGEFCTTP